MKKSNYRPISILSNVYKVYKRLICKQMCSYIDRKFSKYHRGFCNGFNTQPILCLVVMTGKMKIPRDDKQFYTDFLKYLISLKSIWLYKPQSNYYKIKCDQNFWTSFVTISMINHKKLKWVFIQCWTNHSKVSFWGWGCAPTHPLLASSYG